MFELKTPILYDFSQKFYNIVRLITIIRLLTKLFRCRNKLNILDESDIHLITLNQMVRSVKFHNHESHIQPRAQKLPNNTHHKSSAQHFITKRTNLSRIPANYTAAEIIHIKRFRRILIDAHQKHRNKAHLLQSKFTTYRRNATRIRRITKNKRANPPVNTHSRNTIALYTIMPVNTVVGNKTVL